MRRWVSWLVFLVCFAVGGQVAMARDQSWWGWLDELSGPGAFTGSSVELFKLCSDKGVTTVDTDRDPPAPPPTVRGIKGWSFGTPTTSTHCFWADQRFLHVGKDQDFPAIQASLYDQGLSYTWRRLVSVGAGVGLIRFNSEGPTEHVTTTRLTVTPFRLTVNPLHLYWSIEPPSTQRQKVWSNIMSVPQAYYKVVCIPGKLNGGNFGAPTSTFTSSGECLESYGIQLNFTELLR